MVLGPRAATRTGDLMSGDEGKGHVAAGEDALPQVQMRHCSTRTRTSPSAGTGVESSFTSA